MPTHSAPEGPTTWYVDEGIGDPLVLLHGGFGHGGDLEHWAAELRGSRRVLRQDRRGHGRSPDVPGPITTALMAADTIAWLDDVVGGPADLVGYSDGAATALYVALHRPDLVRRLVCLSGVFHADGWLPGLVDDVGEAAAAMAGTPMARTYAALSPDGPEHFPVVAEKLLVLTTTDPVLTVSDLAGVRARTLVAAADDDIVTLEHTIAFYRALPDAELAVVPGTSHGVADEKPELLLRLIAEFLDEDPVPTTVPVRRAGVPVSR